MYRYYCDKCKEHFFREKANINERHGCGEFARIEWGVVYEAKSSDL